MKTEGSLLLCMAAFLVLHVSVACSLECSTADPERGASSSVCWELRVNCHAGCHPEWRGQ